MAQRIKGQEIKCIATGPAGVEEGLIDIRSLDLEIDIEILEDAILGETSNRYDDIFNGVGGNGEAQLESRLFMDFIGRVSDRAQRRLPAATQFNITAAFAFPSGVRPRLLFEDVFFGNMSLRTASRKDYTLFRFEWKGSTLRRIG